MICPVCGANNPDGSNVCASCGSPLQQAFDPSQQPYQQPYPGQQPYQQPYPGQQPYYGGQRAIPNPGIQKREIVTAIILSIVTCGIYGIIWFINLTDDSNKLSGDPNATSGGMAFLFGLLTCGIYMFYWAYKRGEIIDNLNVQRGMPRTNNAVLYLVLNLFGLGIVTYCLMQSELNKVADGI
ncbi:MAG: DUF4234 domain-containing protein [Oscillospiraceae bacterium]|nr:DUF4234 domain-containing protein [Oscillospiraceae bacterium]